MNQGRAALVIADGDSHRAIEIADSNIPPGQLSRGDIDIICRSVGVTRDEAQAILATTKGNLDLAKNIASSIPESSSPIPESDIEIVDEQSGVTKDAAAQVLREEDGDLIAAVSRLEDRRNHSQEGNSQQGASDTEIWDPE